MEVGADSRFRVALCGHIGFCIRRDSASVRLSPKDLIFAHQLVSWLLPDELEALADLLERMPLPAPSGCVVPLAEFRRLVAAEFGEECHAVRQLDSLIL